MAGLSGRLRNWVAPARSTLIICTGSTAAIHSLAGTDVVDAEI
jgi:hypothetical protein